MTATSTDMTTMTAKVATEAAGASSTGSRQDMSQAAGMFFFVLFISLTILKFNLGPINA